MQPSTIGARRMRTGLAAAGLAALLALFSAPATAGTLSAQQIPSDARLLAGQSWDPPKFSITEMRPGTIDQGRFARYIQEVGAGPHAAEDLASFPTASKYVAARVPVRRGSNR